MTINLIKTHDSTKNAPHFSQMDINAVTTEHALNDNEQRLIEHKTSETATVQRTLFYENKNVRSELTQIQSQINKIILDTFGNNINEVVDARVDYTGRVFTTLKILLDNYLPKVVENGNHITVLLLVKNKVELLLAGSF